MRPSVWTDTDLCVRLAHAPLAIYDDTLRVRRERVIRILGLAQGGDRRAGERTRSMLASPAHLTLSSPLSSLASAHVTAHVISVCALPRLRALPSRVCAPHRRSRPRHRRRQAPVFRTHPPSPTGTLLLALIPGGARSVLHSRNRVRVSRSICPGRSGVEYGSCKRGWVRKPLSEPKLNLPLILRLRGPPPQGWVSGRGDGSGGLGPASAHPPRPWLMLGLRSDHA